MSVLVLRSDARRLPLPADSRRLERLHSASGPVRHVPAWAWDSRDRREAQRAARKDTAPEPNPVSPRNLK